MTWNHRVIRHADKHDTVGIDIWLGVHECFYDNPEDEIPTSWTDEAIAPIEQTLPELTLTIRRFKEALDKPILEIDGDKLKIWKEKP